MPLNTQDYRLAPTGKGPQASQWADKPWRLIYDLCNEIDNLRKAGQEEIIWNTDEMIGMREGDLCGRWRGRYIDVVFSERDEKWSVYYDNKKLVSNVASQELARKWAESLAKNASD